MSNTPELLLIVQPPSSLRFPVTHTWASLQTPLPHPAPFSPPLLLLSSSAAHPFLHTHPIPPLLSARFTLSFTHRQLSVFTKRILNSSPPNSLSPLSLKRLPSHVTTPLVIHFVCISFTSSILPYSPVLCLTSSHLMWGEVRINKILFLKRINSPAAGLQTAN